MTFNGVRNGPYFALFHQSHVYDVVVKQLPRFQNLLLINLLLIVYDHISTICAIIQRLLAQNKL